jgi:hypothetical protein
MSCLDRDSYQGIASAIPFRVTKSIAPLGAARSRQRLKAHSNPLDDGKPKGLP